MDCPEVQDGRTDGPIDRQTDRRTGRTGQDDGVICTTGRGTEVQDGMIDRRSERASVCVSILICDLKPLSLWALSHFLIVFEIKTTQIYFINISLGRGLNCSWIGRLTHIAIPSKNTKFLRNSVKIRYFHKVSKNHKFRENHQIKIFNILTQSNPLEIIIISKYQVSYTWFFRLLLLFQYRIIFTKS